MRGGFARLPAVLFGAWLMAAAMRAAAGLPEPLIGEFNVSATSFPLYTGPGLGYSVLLLPRIERGRFVRLVDATPNYLWYRAEIEGEGRRVYGWIEARYFIIRGKQSYAGYLLDAQRQQETARRAEERRQRILEEEARRETERLAREAKKAEAERLRQEAENAKRVQQELLRWEQEQKKREEEARRAAERQAKIAREQALREAVERRRFGTQLLVALAIAVPLSFLLLLIPLYRVYAEYRLTHWRGWDNAPLFACSGLFLVVSLAMILGGFALENPYALLVIVVLGVPAWYFVPGAFWVVGIFLHSLFVPHPMERASRRILESDRVRREDLEEAGQGMYDAVRDGLPSDWRLQSRIWRLNRLEKLLHKEKALAGTIVEHVRNQDDRRR